jgi:prevent-host-death family protein
MTTVNVHEAKSTLSQLLVQVEQGEDIVIARNGVPVARLTAVPRRIRRQPGVLQNSPGWENFRYDPALFAPMTDRQLEEEGWPT